MDEITVKIKEYLNLLNKNVAIIEQNNAGLIDFVIAEVIDRVQLYLNSDIVPNKLERILANVVNTGLKRCLKDKELTKEDITAQDRVVTAVSDNGQSISYANEVTKYFATVSDEELFTGFVPLLNRYRRVKVVYPNNNA
jgi:hypothetical protein